VTLAALDAGKHVLVEKPLCVTFREADAVVAAARATGLVVQVGYMRRYAPAFRQAIGEVATIGDIRLARVHDVLGSNELIGNQANDVIRLGPRTDSPIDEETRTQLHEVTGDDELRAETYHFLLTLASHDLSAMRELLGTPHGVLYSAVRKGRESRYVTAAFDYGSFVCHFETGYDRIPRVDQRIEVFADEGAVDVRWDSGFVRNLPVVLTTTRPTPAGGVEQRVVQPDWGDPYVEEWRAFCAAVARRAPVQTPAADAKQDLELALSIVDALPERVPS
jgi:predicted dehydrogenase